MWRSRLLFCSLHLVALNQKGYSILIRFICVWGGIEASIIDFSNPYAGSCNNYGIISFLLASV